MFNQGIDKYANLRREAAVAEAIFNPVDLPGFLAGKRFAAQRREERKAGKTQSADLAASAEPSSAACRGSAAITPGG